MRIVRWIALAPAAILLGYLAYLLGGTINNLATVLTIGSREGWVRIATDFMAHSYLGAGIVFAAVKIAPSKPRIVGSSSFAALVALCATSGYLAVNQSNWTALLAAAGVLFGAFVVLLGVLSDEIRPFEAKSGTPRAAV